MKGHVSGHCGLYTKQLPEALWRHLYGAKIAYTIPGKPR